MTRSRRGCQRRASTADTQARVSARPALDLRYADKHGTTLHAQPSNGGPAFASRAGDCRRLGGCAAKAGRRARADVIPERLSPPRGCLSRMPAEDGRQDPTVAVAPQSPDLRSRARPRSFPSSACSPKPVTRLPGASRTHCANGCQEPGRWRVLRLVAPWGRHHPIEARASDPPHGAPIGRPGVTADRRPR
jgi:hypothetical protein